jgi:thiol:disulfide interchange protein DsbD
VLAKNLLLVVFLVGCAAACTKSDAPVSKGIWETSLKSALLRAQNESKPVLIDFGADWCRPCKRMHQEVFVDPKIQIHLVDNFVPVLIDATDMTHALSKLLQSYRVVTLPSVVFLRPNGDFLESQTLVGYSAVEALDERLLVVLKVVSGA